VSEFSVIGDPLPVGSPVETEFGVDAVKTGSAFVVAFAAKATTTSQPLSRNDLEQTKEPSRRTVYTVYMSKTVRLPKDIHEELKTRKRPDETIAEVIARHLHRPHPAETRDILTAEESEAVEDAIDGLYGTDESDRLARARRAFADTDPDDEENTA